MNTIRYTFKDLVKGDEIIVTDFVSFCDYYTVIGIAKAEMGWHFVLEHRKGTSTNYVEFWVNELEYTTQIHLDNGHVVYVNAIDFLEDCDTRRDRIQELKDNFIKGNDVSISQ